MKKHFSDQIWSGPWYPLSTACCNAFLVSSTKMGKSSVCILALVETLIPFITEFRSTGPELACVLTVILQPCSNKKQQSVGLPLQSSQQSKRTAEPYVNSLLPLHRQPLGQTGRATNLFCLLSLFMDNILNFQNSLWQRELELKKIYQKLVRPECHSSYFLLCLFTTTTTTPDKSSQLTGSVCEWQIFYC